MSDRLWPLLHESELDDLPEPRWLVDGHLTDGLAVMYGPPKQGKTFLALDWALSIGCGARWHGHGVEHSPVVYVSGEGHGGIGKRRHAWKVARSQFAPKLYVIPFPVRFGSVREHAIGLRADVHSTAAGLVVIDTLARSMAGADENSSQDMGQYIHTADWLRDRTGCGVLIVHHSGVEGSRPRGSSALFGAADTLVRVDGEGGYLRVSCEGQKDAAPFRTRHFALTSVAESMVLEERQPPVASRGHTPF